MKIKVLCRLVVLSLFLTACAGIANTPTPLPTVILGNPASTPVPNTSSSGTVTASGIIVPDQESHLAFGVAGIIKLIQAKAGDQVQAGQILLQLDDSAQQIQLEQAKQALQELTSPEAIANAELAITTAELNITNAQTALNNEQYWKNDALIKNYYANYVIAKAALDQAQSAYDAAKVGQYINNADEAEAYQKLYNAKQAYDTAFYYYSLYSQAPTQRQMDEAQAKLDLANATLTNAKNYLTALTGGSVPADASGAAIESLHEAQLAVQKAQINLDATWLVSPFAGEIASLNVNMGDYVLPGQVILVISDVTHLHVETTDLSERAVPQVKLGQAVSVTVKALNQDVPGKVTEISPLAESLGGDVVYRVTIALDNLPPGLRAGMSVDAQFNTGQ